jgi:hypothetical protein
VIRSGITSVGAFAHRIRSRTRAGLVSDWPATSTVTL